MPVAWTGSVADSEDAPSTYSPCFFAPWAAGLRRTEEIGGWRQKATADCSRSPCHYHFCSICPLVEKMFKKLAKQLIQELDSDGKLIPVSSLAQNDGFQIFSLVTKKPYKWPWNNRKYSPISFKLADILQEEAIMEIELKHSEPLLFFANTCHKSGGRLNFKIRSTEVDVGGLALACLNASSVHLRKTYVDPGELWKRDICLSVVQQMYPKLHLYIVTEVLEITEPFLIEEIVQTGGKGEVSAMDILKIQGQHTTMKNKSMLIPFGTVMAYGVEKFQICEEDPVYLNQRFQTMLVPSPTYDAFQSELGSSLTASARCS